MKSAGQPPRPVSQDRRTEDTSRGDYLEDEERSRKTGKHRRKRNYASNVGPLAIVTSKLYDKN